MVQRESLLQRVRMYADFLDRRIAEFEKKQRTYGKLAFFQPQIYVLNEARKNLYSCFPELREPLDVVRGE